MYAIFRIAEIREKDSISLSPLFDNWVESLPLRGWTRATKEKNRCSIRTNLDNSSILAQMHATLTKALEVVQVSELYESKDLCAQILDLKEEGWDHIKEIPLWYGVGRFWESIMPFVRPDFFVYRGFRSALSKSLEVFCVPVRYRYEIREVS